MRTCILCFLALVCAGRLSWAQQPQSGACAHGNEMPSMHMEETTSPSLPSFTSSSGTAWQPASIQEPMWMIHPGNWQLMLHGTVFVTYNQQGGSRGEGKAESVNYAMTMEQHRLGKGKLLLRQMFSAESLTSPHPGFPELFQTGETYHGQPLVDHQHPHNVFAELAGLYLLPIRNKISWLLYGGASAEPALGPVTYLHRQSASENPAAPLGHHLQDSTHTSFGVVTSGFIIDRLKIEGSVFNGHEPNEQRWSIQLGTLDSWSVRGTVAPVRNWVAQYSYGLLVHPEALEPGSQRRQSASIEYNRLLPNGYWATSVIWGRVQKDFEAFPLNSYLLESTVNFFQRNYAYTRMELVDKDELFGDGPGHPSYRIGAYTFGGVRDLVHNHDWQLGLGADATFYSKPAVLNPVYGNDPVSFHVFLRIRPGLPEHQH
ncbi:MAG TPA: hypothetical protein VEI26_07375 [Terriglobales bacterium]|nr:hypothetical protein [Terriglobales bacterium]